MSRPGDKHWTRDQVAILVAYYATEATESLAVRLGKTPDAVRTKAIRLGLHKAQETLPDGLRRCPHCKQIKNTTDGFWANQSWCKDCLKNARSEWEEQNRTHLAKYYYIRLARNPDRIRATAARAAHKQRAPIKEGHDLTEQEWKEIIGQQGNKCALCSGLFIENDPPVRDCILPLCKGGRLTRTNVQAVHDRCNGMKGTRILRGMAHRQNCRARYV